MRRVDLTGGMVQVIRTEVPTVPDRHVRVRVHAAGLNRADLMMLEGTYPTGLTAPGLEYAGVVDSVGAGATRHRIGNRVFGITAGSAQAEFLVAHEDLVAPMGPTLPMLDAGGIPEVFVTAYDALVTQAQVQPGELVFINAIGSGVGLASLALAKAAGATVAGSSRSPAKLEHARELGLDHGILANAATDLLDAFHRRISPGVIIDLLGGPYLDAATRIARTRARIVTLGGIAGAEARLDIATLLTKRVQIHGSILTARADEEKVALAHLLGERIGPMIERGVLPTVPSVIVPLAEAPGAYDALATGAAFGKVILDVGTSTTDEGQLSSPPHDRRVF
jgi:NADPH:quinone reductase-like Zn-dependent oxidoreductase